MTKDLIERLEAATGADRELDAAIVAFLNDAALKRYPPSDDYGPRDRWQFWSLDEKHFLGSESSFPVPSYTASLDAALALVGEKLPGAGVSIITDTRGALAIFIKPGCKWISVGSIEDRKFSPTPALAVLIALFRALETK